MHELYSDPTASTWNNFLGFESQFTCNDKDLTTPLILVIDWPYFRVVRGCNLVEYDFFFLYRGFESIYVVVTVRIEYLLHEKNSLLQQRYPR